MHDLAMMGQMPTMENAQALYKMRHQDDTPKTAEDEETSWRDYFS